ncbi:hypothetical protein AAG906_025643 [Vitis piasezkii]
MIKALKGKPIRTFLTFCEDSYEDKKVPKCLGKLNHLRISDNIGELINLKHLENGGWRLRNHKIGSLIELESLNHLRGGLCISNLQNVRDVELVSRGEILKGKQYLQSLRLEWNRSVMEGLQPHPQLKDIFIKGYGGTEFPSWMMNDRLDAKFCHPFSTPSLKSLKLDDMKEVVELNAGSSATPFFPFLESFELSNMPKLKELWRMDLLAEEGPSFSHLSQLEIRNCHNLASLELHSSPSLSRLMIDDCPNLTSMELPDQNCHNLASLELHSSPSLSQLMIYDCPNLTFMELPSSLCLSYLDIRRCPNLASFKVAPLPSLETLSLSTVRYGLLQHISGLVTLVILECPNLQSLELHSSPSLSQLAITDCPNLASFNVASLPRLEELSLRGVRAEVLRQLMFVSASSLKSLCICEMDVYMPDEPLQYVSTLETLHIVMCSGLATLLHWMGSLSSLTELIIFTLQTLYFCDYPHLEERYKETGKDWAKIAHIPHVRFNRDRYMIEQVGPKSLIFLPILLF